MILLRRFTSIDSVVLPHQAGGTKAMCNVHFESYLQQPHVQARATGCPVVRAPFKRSARDGLCDCE